MEYRMLGKTGLKVSALGFGCGAVGGLMINCDFPTMVRAVERAMEAGINYFDTAQLYGNGQSETNLGKVLLEIKPDIIVGTKVRLSGADMDRIEAAVIEAAEVSLKRLHRERLDLFQLHNPIHLQPQPEKGWLGIDDLAAVGNACRTLQAQGKIRFWGINGLGETEALQRAVAESGADTIQCCYNILNPSGGRAMPVTFPFQDYQQLINRAVEQKMGVIAIRILAGGALSAQTERHPMAAQSVEPIGTSHDFAADVAAAQRFQFLVEDGWAASPVEAAIRFALSDPSISTALVGLSSLKQLNQAINAAEKGPLSTQALERLPAVWQALGSA